MQSVNKSELQTSTTQSFGPQAISITLLFAQTKYVTYVKPESQLLLLARIHVNLSALTICDLVDGKSFAILSLMCVSGKIT